MTHLSDQQIKFYNEKGYIAPIDVLSIKEANEIREEIETIEKKWPNALEGLGRNYVCLLYTSPSPRDRTRSRMPSSA